MSTTIDQRIVEMRFDNKQFEQNVSTTMSSLDKLKQKLKLDGVSKGLEEVNTAAGRVDMSRLGNGVEKVGLKFSGLYTVADQALRNITNSVQSTATRMVKAFTIDPIKTGFSEYETQIKAIQTILANTESKGTTLDNVNTALDELNAYADKTIYNFTEMTRNIGTFTAAGVDLDTSVAAIKGIANLAAVSGSTSQQASTAMYQLSQALSSGTVRLMDWNSVVNAGMGGQVFQDALKETARVHGIAIDDIIKQEGSFRESLSQGWLSSEILTETLSKFTGDLNREQLKSMGYTEDQIEGILKLGQTANDAATKVKTFSQLRETLMEAAQSGWAQSWEIIVGDFEEAKELFTLISDTLGGLIGKSAESRNDLLENWKVLGGRDEIIDALKYSFDAVMSIVQAVSDAMAEVFPPLTAEKLVAFCTGLKELAKNFAAVFKVNGKATSTFNKLKRTLKGVFAVVDIVRMTFVSFVKALLDTSKPVGSFLSGILNVTAGFGDWLVRVRDALKYSGLLDRVMSGLSTILGAVFDSIVAVGKAIKNSFIFEAVIQGLESFIDLIIKSKDGTDYLAQAAENIKNAWKNGGLSKFLSDIWIHVQNIGKAIGQLFSELFSGFENAFGRDDWVPLMDLLKGIFGGGLIAGAIVLIKKLKDVFSNSSGGFRSLVDGFSNTLDGLGDSLQTFQSRINTEALKAIAVAIAILVGSLVVLSFISPDKLTNSIIALGLVMALLAVMMKVMNKISSAGDASNKLNGGIIKASLGLIAISAALLLAAASLKLLATMEWDEIGRGLTAMLGVLTLLVAAQVICSKFSSGGKAAASAGAMVIMVLAIDMLVPALMALGSLSNEALIKAGISLVTITAILVSVQVMFSKIEEGIGRMIAGSIAMAIMAAAINKLLPTLLAFSVMPWDTLIKALLGLITVVGALVSVQVLYTKLGKDSRKMLVGALAMGIMAYALDMLIPVLTLIAALSWESMIKSCIGLTLIVSSLGAALVLMSNFGGNSGKIMAAAGAMVIMAVSIMGLSAALIALGSINPQKLLAAVISLGVVLGGIVGLGYAVKPIIGYLVKFAGVVALFGAAILAAGAGMLLFGLGLSAVAMGISKLAEASAALINGLASMSTALVTVISAVIEGVIRGIGAGLKALAQLLIDNVPLIAEVGIVLIVALCDVLVQAVPVLIDTLLTIVLKLCEAANQFIPPIVATIVQLITGIINALASELPGLIDALVNLLFAFVEGTINALGGMNPDGLLQALKNMGMLTAIITMLATMQLLAPAAMVGVIAMGIVVAELAAVLATLGKLGSIPGLQDAIGNGGSLLQVVGTAIGQFIGGLVGGFAKGATADLPEIATNLAGFAENIGGFLSIAPSLADSVKSLAGASIATSIADFFNGDGSSMDVFATELPKLGEGLAGFSDAIGERSFSNVSAAVEGAKGLAEVAAAIPNAGGWVGAIVGENSIAAFGDDLIKLGAGLAGFADVIGDRSFDNVGNAVNAGLALAELAHEIPNEGGVVAWFAGENSISKFGDELIKLGAGIKGFADQVSDIPDISAAITAAAQLVELTNNIPKEEGVAQWFTGTASISKYSAELANLGKGIYDFSTNVGDADPNKVAAAAQAAMHIADLTNAIPKEEGVAQWFTGTTSLSKFADDMGSLGAGISSFAENTSTVDPEKVKAAADAAVAIAGITKHAPKADGVAQWFTGETSLSKFADDMGSLGTGLKSFADNTTGISVEEVQAAADAAVAIAGITEYIPKSDGVAQWFTGEASISKFADQLPTLGAGLAGFVSGLGNAELGNVEAAANAAKALAEMTQHVPNEGGIAAWFTGESSMANFADQLPALGSGIKGFSDSITGMKPENVEVGANAAKALGEMAGALPSSLEMGRIGKFGDKLKTFGEKMMSFINQTKGITTTAVSGANTLVTLAKDASAIDSGAIKNVASALDKLTKAAKDMEKDIKSNMKDAGKKAVEGYINGMNDKLKDAKTAMSDLADKVADKAADKASAFTAAGKDCVQGFANGIKNNKYLATDAGSEVGKAALEAAKAAVDSNSPSKEFMKLGRDSDIGFAKGLTRYADLVYDSSYEVGRSGVDGLGKSISKISRLVENGIDTQPHIRPVLDLSDVENGVGRIGGLFAGTPLGVRANIGAISSMMNSRSQNGANKDVTDAIKELRDDISKIKTNVYNVNGVTYDDGSNVADAVSTLIRAARIERRV